MDIIKFDSTEEQLKEIVALTSSITADDLENKQQLDIVKKNRISLKNARVAITKKGKEMRDEATQYAKKVIAREKELIGIIEPEEERLQAIEDEAKNLTEMKRRKSVLSEKMEKLAKSKIEANEEYILTLGELEFSTFFNQKIEERNALETARIEKEKQDIENEKNKIAREKEIEEAKKKGEEEARIKFEKYEQERKDREEIEKQEKETARIQKEKDDEEKMKKETKYQEWLKDNGYCETAKDDFIIQKNGKEVKLFKIIGTYILE